MTFSQVESIDISRIKLNTMSIAVIVICTSAFVILHQSSAAVGELTKDSFELLPMDWLPLSQSVKHCILFAGIGCALSWSAVLLISDLFKLTTLAGGSTFVFRNLKLIFIFLASSLVAGSILGHAYFDS